MMDDTDIPFLSMPQWNISWIPYCSSQCKTMHCAQKVREEGIVTEDCIVQFKVGAVFDHPNRFVAGVYASSKLKHGS